MRKKPHISIVKSLIQLALRPATILVVFGVSLGALYVVEDNWVHMPFIALIIVLIASLAFAITKRIGFSSYFALASVFVVTLISVAKFRSKGFDLHVYDFAFTGTDLEALKFLGAEYTTLVAPVLALLVVGVTVLALVWRNERPTKLPARYYLSVPALSAILLPISYPLDASEPRYFHYLSGYNTSSFFISFLDIADSFTQEPIIASFDAEKAKPFQTTNSCEGFDIKPDIYVVLSESATNFDIYPQVNTRAVPSNSFESQDGKKHTLHVETFGGGTWVSNLSLMTGLPTREFGWRSPYLTVQLQDRVKASLATLLNGCGYKSAVVMPMKHSFVNEGPFLESIGFDTVMGYNEIGASLYNHRDNFYYNAADTLIEQHITTDGRPLFMEVQTMFAHSPFADRREEQIQIQKEAFSDDPSLNEHIRRVYIAQNDFKAFIERRKKLQPDRPFVVLEFGDHQALVTLQMADEITGGNSLADPNSIAYQTHYTVHTYNFDMDMDYLGSAQLDIGFLGVSFMQSIGVPLTPMYEDLASLRDQCNGRFAGCSNPLAVNMHLSRRISSGLLTLPSS